MDMTPSGIVHPIYAMQLPPPKGCRPLPYPHRIGRVERVQLGQGGAAYLVMRLANGTELYLRIGARRPSYVAGSLTLLYSLGGKW